MKQPGRQRLRQWLEEQIQSGRHPGFSWLDQSARIFQIPWKHAARHGWSIDHDATLFRSWAMHTGRYRPDKDKPDPKTWKANFRCALNSLPDICELQEYSRKRGSNAFRVYRMLPTTHRRRRDLRLLSEPQDSQASSGEDAYTTHPWQPTTPTEDTVENTPTHGMWAASPEDQEQDEAVFKLMDHLSNADLWNQNGEQRGRRTHTLFGHCQCAAGDNTYSLHMENFNDLFTSDCIQEFSDCSTHQQTQH